MDDNEESGTAVSGAEAAAAGPPKQRRARARRSTVPESLHDAHPYDELLGGDGGGATLDIEALRALVERDAAVVESWAPGKLGTPADQLTAARLRVHGFRRPLVVRAGRGAARGAAAAEARAVREAVGICLPAQALTLAGLAQALGGELQARGQGWLRV